MNLLRPRSGDRKTPPGTTTAFATTHRYGCPTPCCMRMCGAHPKAKRKREESPPNDRTCHSSSKRGLGALLVSIAAPHTNLNQSSAGNQAAPQMQSHSELRRQSGSSPDAISLELRRQSGSSPCLLYTSPSPRDAHES
eukprot:1103274-Prymnesium_polylepis.2